MGFEVKKVRRVRCPRCGRQIDTTEAKPLSSIRCQSCGHKTNVPVKLGKTIQIEKLIGQGTGSIVYEAVDLENRRRLAAKVIKPSDETNKKHVGGIAEAEALMRIKHPNIVEVYGIDVEHGQPCIFMELLPGGSLKSMLDRSGAIIGLVNQ